MNRLKQFGLLLVPIFVVWTITILISRKLYEFPFAGYVLVAIVLSWFYSKELKPFFATTLGLSVGYFASDLWEMPHALYAHHHPWYIPFIAFIPAVWFIALFKIKLDLLKTCLLLSVSLAISVITLIACFCVCPSYLNMPISEYPMTVMLLWTVNRIVSVGLCGLAFYPKGVCKDPWRIKKR